MKKLFDIFFRAGAIPILIIGVWTTQPFNYYVFLHWYIFLYSIYLIYRIVEGDYATKWLIVIIFSGSAIIFNPFIPFTFSKKTWSIIDIILLLIAFFVLAMKIEDYIKLLPKKWKLILKLIKNCFLVCVGMFVAFWVLFSELGNPYHEFLLITQASTVKGFIISSGEQEDDIERYDAIDYQSFDVYYTYTFTTKDGKTIKGDASASVPESGYLAEANVKPIPIEVEYIPNNPKINRVKGMSSPATISEFIWRWGFGTLFIIGICILGFSLIKTFIKDGLAEITDFLEKKRYEITFLSKIDEINIHDSSEPHTSMDWYFIERILKSRNDEDLGTAFYWHKKSAEQGDAQYQFATAIYYYYGIGTRRNKKQAAYWMRKAYNNGYQKAKDKWNKLELWKYEN